MDFLNGASATLERAALGNRKLVERERDAKRRSAEPEGKLGAAVRPASGRPPSVASSAVIRGRRQSQTGSRPPHALVSCARIFSSCGAVVFLVLDLRLVCVLLRVCLWALRGSVYISIYPSTGQRQSEFRFPSSNPTIVPRIFRA
jgi:hypothetical protein